MPEPARLFFALLPPPAVRAALTHAADGVPRPARRVHPQDLHLTLAFLGAADPAPALLEAGTAAAAAGGAFVLHLDHFGCWRRAGIAWAAPARLPEALAALHAGLADALTRRGYPVESRAFRPHVTLARRARRAPPAPATVPEWPVAELVLLASGPPPPPRYRVQACWPLSGGSRNAS